MKRLLLASLIGFACASHAETNKLTTLAVQSAPFAGMALATIYTTGRAAIAHAGYTVSQPDSNTFINTLAYGSRPAIDNGDIFPNIDNIGQSWQIGIPGGTALGILYSLYKHGINRDNLRLAAGIGVSGCALSLVAKKLCKPYYRNGDIFQNIHNIGFGWQIGILGSTILSILYNCYNHGINKDSLNLAAGIGISGYALSLVANELCEPYYKPEYAPDLRTIFNNIQG